MGEFVLTGEWPGQCGDCSACLGCRGNSRPDSLAFSLREILEWAWDPADDTAPPAPVRSAAGALMVQDLLGGQLLRYAASDGEHTATKVFGYVVIDLCPGVDGDATGRPVQRLERTAVLDDPTVADAYGYLRQFVGDKGAVGA
jgi:hypothetical protein